MEAFIHDLRREHDATEWRAVARRELALSMLDQYSSGCNETLLDVGCGTGLLVEQLQERGFACGIDVSGEAIDLASRRGLENVRVGNVEGMGLPGDTFDAATMIEVLEHVDDDMKALREIHRVLRPSGLLVMTVPAFKMLWSDRDVQLHHKRRYTAGELESKIIAAGFKPLICGYIDTFLFFPLLLLVKMSQWRKKPLGMYEVSAPPLINELLLKFCRFERWLGRFIKFPFGVSIVCVAEKA